MWGYYLKSRAITLENLGFLHLVVSYVPILTFSRLIRPWSDFYLIA